MEEDLIMETPFRLEWTVPQEDGGKLLRVFLNEQSISRAALTDIKFGGGSIKVNGEAATVRRLLKEGDLVSVFFPPEAAGASLMAEDIPLDIVYEDDYLLVIAKPPFMNTIPSRERPHGSVANALAGYYKKHKIASTIHIVTRLDRDTSGLMLIAKHRHVHHLLSVLQQEGRVNRFYEALVEGTIEGEGGRIEAPIGRKDSSIIEREVRKDGKYACTGYEIKERLGEGTHIALKLMTGRTHQIRVHMAHIGFPLAGDDLYGGSRSLISRQALHCSRLSFFHPFLGKTLSFSQPLPDDMEKLLQVYRDQDYSQPRNFSGR
ncbi:RluA family pseudouridine synthase [Peribacillus sp. SCS-26]|uniref:RluA family pseudouridine synthase n=1 Tax=Paraperibacillus marinus TaxID=3115295 RepID=UPI0039061BF8